jgi:hypothetical protein
LGCVFGQLQTEHSNGRFAMTKMTPAQTVAGFALFLAVIWTSTAIVWIWPQSSAWILGGEVALVAIFLFFVYRAARKAHPSE